MSLEAVRAVARQVDAVGSRVTCSPAPTGTDQDWLVLVDPENWQAFYAAVKDWEFGGSEIDDLVNRVPPEERFQAFRLGEDNIVVTDSRVFHKRFLAATSVAKHLNLMAKDDRIALFQAVLYGNPVTQPTL